MIRNSNLEAKHSQALFPMIKAISCHARILTGDLCADDRKPAERSAAVELWPPPTGAPERGQLAHSSRTRIDGEGQQRLRREPFGKPPRNGRYLRNAAGRCRRILFSRAEPELSKSRGIPPRRAL